MKFILFLFLLSCLTIDVSAQYNYLGKTRAVIVEKLKAVDNLKPLSSSTTNEGVPYMTYADPDETVLSYYFKGDTCVLYRVIYKIKFLPGVIKEMNEENIRVNDTTWSSKDMRIKVWLEYDDKNKIMFSLIFKMM